MKTLLNKYRDQLLGYAGFSLVAWLIGGTKVLAILLAPAVLALVLALFYGVFVLLGLDQDR